ncbi:MAG: ABC transporter permease [Chloroflexia bacterium]|jgi:ABC-type dipeptide/oligopeptide/nickel transport system permease subunit|nr:ABC transporter permease [Chloroflexia bacterium]
MAASQDSNADHVSQAQLLSEAAEAAPTRQASLWGDAWRRLLRNKLAVIGMVIASMLILIAVFADVIAPYGYAETVAVDLRLTKPSWNFPMGIDQNGRDVFSRVVYGARVSLLVGVAAQLIVLAIGVPVGAMAGYFGGTLDTALMRLVDVVYAIPQLLLVLLIVNMRGPGMSTIFLAIGLTGWVTMARLVRGQMLSIREQEYVKASRVSGAGPGYIIMRHMLPNSMTPIIVALTFGIPTAIFIEASLSFIGVGIRPPQPSWGQMVGTGQQYIRAVQHLMLFPSIAIALTMLAFTFLGDGLRDALDVRLND